METHDHLDEWVNRRMAGSQSPPGWPDVAAARRRLDRRLAMRPRHRLIWIGVTTAACAALLVLPQSRAVAQRLWDQVVVGRLHVLITDDRRVDVGAFSPDLQHRPEAHPVLSVEEATRVAGFPPRLPGLQLFAAPPSYSVTDVTSATLRLRTAALRQLFVRAGGSPEEVPDAWSDALLEIRIGPVIIADYGGTLLLQSRPFQLITPPDFDLERFYRIAFRSLGWSEQEARALSTDLGISPALLTFMPMEDKDLVHEFETRSGTGMMIEEVYGAGKILAVWTGSDRIYALFPEKGAISREFVREVANTLE
jgi:hypothetical protein